MGSYLVKRIGFLILTLFGITFVSFIMLQLAPGSPLEMKLAQDKGGGLGEKSVITEEAKEQLKKLYHLDRPLLVRYGLWLNDLAHLNLGESFTDHRPVLEKIKERLPVSLIFGISSILVALLIGIPLGLISGAFQNSVWDRWITFVVIAKYSLPTYVLGILLLTFFGGGDFLNWFPIYGIQSDHYESLSLSAKFLDRLHHFILPCICYSIGTLAYITQQQRASFLEALHQDYIRTARAKGLPERLVLFKHAFRNSLIPIVTILGGMIPGILGGGVIVESLFSIPGLGLLAYESLLARDYPTIMANFTISAFLSLLGIFLSDLCYAWVDPRIDFEGR
jgi:ABC-type dipeptide/oligopeptide/nickel transport system permease component